MGPREDVCEHTHRIECAHTHECVNTHRPDERLFSSAVGRRKPACRVESTSRTTPPTASEKRCWPNRTREMGTAIEIAAGVAAAKAAGAEAAGAEAAGAEAAGADRGHARARQTGDAGVADHVHAHQTSAAAAATGGAVRRGADPAPALRAGDVASARREQSRAVGCRSPTA
eukprot:SAG31_NODE_3907_length_3763_cov_18.329421_3_plen_172_part_00